MSEKTHLNMAAPPFDQKKGEAEPAVHFKYRTVTCRHWRRGHCDLSEACQFKHESDESGAKSNSAKKFQFNPKSAEFTPIRRPSQPAYGSTPVASNSYYLKSCQNDGRKSPDLGRQDSGGPSASKDGVDTVAVPIVDSDSSSSPGHADQGSASGVAVPLPWGNVPSPAAVPFVFNPIMPMPPAYCGSLGYGYYHQAASLPYFPAGNVLPVMSQSPHVHPMIVPPYQLPISARAPADSPIGVPPMYPLRTQAPAHYINQFDTGFDATDDRAYNVHSKASQGIPENASF